MREGRPPHCMSSVIWKLIYESCGGTSGELTKEKLKRHVSVEILTSVTARVRKLRRDIAWCLIPAVRVFKAAWFRGKNIVPSDLINLEGFGLFISTAEGIHL